MRPGLEASIPERCTSDQSKLLYLMTHRELAHQLKGVPLKCELADHGSISMTATGSLELTNGPGQLPMRLNNLHDDLARMLENYDRRESRGAPSVYVAATHWSLDKLLFVLVQEHYTDVRTHDGGALARNTRGGNTFDYATMQQVLVSEDPSQVGLECLAAADFHLYKSMGLIPPELSRTEVEHRYTSIHGDSQPGAPRLPHELNKSLRGIPGGKAFTPREAVAFANALRADDWAKLTGADRGTYSLKSLPTIGAVANHFERGGAAVHTGWANGGHHFVLSMVAAKGDDIRVNEDDSLRLSPLLREEPKPGLDEKWPHGKSYDPQEHANFWAIAR